MNYCIYYLYQYKVVIFIEYCRILTIETENADTGVSSR